MGFVNGGDDVIPAAARGTAYQGLAHAVDMAATLLAAAGVATTRTVTGHASTGEPSRGRAASGTVVVRDNTTVDGYNLLPQLLHGAVPVREEVPINIYDEGRWAEHSPRCLIYFRRCQIKLLLISCVSVMVEVG